MKKFAATILVLCTILTLFTACAEKNSDNSDDGEKLNIITTIFPPYDFAQQVTGDKANVTMLLSPAAESHSYEPTPQDIIKISECDLFICIGGIGESWVESIVDTLDGKINILRLLDTADIAEEEITEGMQADDDEGDHIEYDEHIWTSTHNAVKMINAICETICRIDSENAAEYNTNTENYVSQINALDTQFTEMFANSEIKTIVFGDRFPFRYFADDYELTYYAAFPGCSEETEPSAATVAFLIDKVKSAGITAVFYLEFSNHSIADTIAQAAGAHTAMLHSCHNVSKSELDSGETYVSLMTKNYETLKNYY